MKLCVRYAAGKMAVKNIVALIVVTVVLSSACYPQAATQEEPVFRAPFKLKLHVDNERYYEETFDHVPYVADNDVYLFAGEAFGINVSVTENEVSRIAYQRDPAKADVELKFTQEKSPNGWMMMMVIRNKLKRRLFLDALMTLPEKKEIYKTSILPVEPNLSNFESWPHPIVQLVLQNFRFSENGSKQSAVKEQTETVDPKTGNLHLTIPVVASTKPKP
jgi:hypothetical protein